MRRSYVGIVIGVVLAIVAVVLLNFYIRGLGGAPVTPMITVVTAAQDLPFGTKLSAGLLRTTLWPTTSVPDGAFTGMNDIFKDAKDPADRIVIVALTKGEPVLKSKISGFGTRPIMSTRVDKDMRAISIHIDDVSGVAGFILPGDHVDILLTRHLGNGEQNLATDLILQDIQVLGIDQLADQSADKPIVARTATVKVTPDQAQKLVLAQQAGTLSLTLRNMDTINKITPSRVVERDLANVAPQQPRATTVRPPEIRVRYGDGSVVSHSINPLN